MDECASLQPLDFLIFDKFHVHCSIKRGDLLLGIPEGNKWWKLKHNLTHIQKLNATSIVTCGGAFSNHLVAVSQLSALMKLPISAFVRSYQLDEKNPTFQICHANGMILTPLHPAEYKVKAEELLHHVNKPNDIYFIPEGGSNSLAFKGVGDMVDEILDSCADVTDIVLPIGTGGTYYGIANHLSKHIRLTGISILKADLWLHIERNFGSIDAEHCTINQDYHFGGYGKTSAQLIDFIKHFFEESGIILDGVYNGKAMYGMLDLLSKGYFPTGSKIVYIHTGGTQGNLGLNYRFNYNLPSRPLQFYMV